MCLTLCTGEKELKVSLDVPVKCTRSADAPGFVLSSPNLQCYKRSVEYLGGKSWNGLSTELRPIPKCDELAKFKAHCYPYLIIQFYGLIQLP